VCISKALVSHYQLRNQRPLAPEIWAEIWASVKVNWVGRNACPIFRRLWTKVHQIWYAHRGVIAVFNAVFRSTISCSCPEIFAIKSQNPKFWCFGAPKFFGGGTPQISYSHLKITATTEHMAKFGDDRPRDSQDWAAKKKRIETSAVKYNGRRPASWRAAIIISCAESFAWSMKVKIRCFTQILSLTDGDIARLFAHLQRTAALENSQHDR